VLFVWLVTLVVGLGLWTGVFGGGARWWVRAAGFDAESGLLVVYLGVSGSGVGRGRVGGGSGVASAVRVWSRACAGRWVRSCHGYRGIVTPPGPQRPCHHAVATPDPNHTI
jgi:hypothetical protein